MIQTLAQPDSKAAPTRSVWGLDAAALHERYWSSRGVQVIRPRAAEPIARRAELFLLLDDRALLLMDLPPLVKRIQWVKPRVLLVRTHARSAREYQERLRVDATDRLVSVERAYAGPPTRYGRVALTTEPRLAQRWQASANVRRAWRSLKRHTTVHEREPITANCHWFDGQSPLEQEQYVLELVKRWDEPAAAVGRVRQGEPGVWVDASTPYRPAGRAMGPLWIGAGRATPSAQSMAGPAVLWDEPKSRPALEPIDWDRIAAAGRSPSRQRNGASPRFFRYAKRSLDIALSLVALTVTLPLYPLIMWAIVREDGWPVFFVHHRESIGGRPFGCIKFRTMRRDAEQIKRKLVAGNVCDGPQFFMENDPRVTRVGHLLRRTNLDEIPQFINVLLGHMSVVGPRPSPFSENQYCPPWRDARLSVRPGITGLWQIMRRREQGTDFQEWIRYDLAYVQHQSMRRDLWIIWRTALLFLGRVHREDEERRRPPPR